MSGNTIFRDESHVAAATPWRLPEPCHPLLRPDRAGGAVTSNPGFEFLTLFIPATLRTACASVAEPAPAAEPPIPGRDPHPDSGRPPAAERFFPITDTWVASRARFSLRQNRHLPTMHIVARWLATFGFDIGQRVRVQAEKGRLILTAIDPAAERSSLDPIGSPDTPRDRRADIRTRRRAPALHLEF